VRIVKAEEGVLDWEKAEYIMTEEINWLDRLPSTYISFVDQPLNNRPFNSSPPSPSLSFLLNSLSLLDEMIKGKHLSFPKYSTPQDRYC